MKRLIAAAVLIILVFSALITDILLTNKVLKTVTNDISRCKTAAEQGDYKSAEKYADILENDWVKIEHYYSPFINHNLIENMAISISKLKPLAKTQNNMYLTECRVIEMMLIQIKDYSHLNIHNLL